MRLRNTLVFRYLGLASQRTELQSLRSWRVLWSGKGQNGAELYYLLCPEHIEDEHIEDTLRAMLIPSQLSTGYVVFDQVSRHQRSLMKGAKSFLAGWSLMRGPLADWRVFLWQDAKGRITVRYRGDVARQSENNIPRGLNSLTAVKSIRDRSLRPGEASVPEKPKDEKSDKVFIKVKKLLSPDYEP